jgi:hypothetical protein
MEERRRAPRIKEENEVSITVVSGGINLPEEQIKDNFTKDISVSGAKIQTNILLPVNTLIELDFTSKGLQQQMKILGKIKWRKAINENESYEFGVEFYPGKEIEKLEDYIFWQLKSDKSEFIKNGLPSIDSVNKKIAETNKLSPIDSGYINIEETQITPPIVANKKNIIEISKLSPMDSGYINFDENKKLFSMDSGNINIEETPKVYPMSSNKKNIAATQKVPPVKNNRWTIMTIFSLGTIGTIILIVVLLNLFGYLDLDFIYPHTNKQITNNSAHVSTTTKPATLPEPPIAAPAPKEASSPLPAPASQVTQIVKVIGNRDSRIYHLPGMKYYNAVKAYHRVEFDSETDAINAGYRKAPR